jgi:uncharacterized membrane protein
LYSIAKDTSAAATVLAAVVAVVAVVAVEMTFKAVSSKSVKMRQREDMVDDDSNEMIAVK